MCDALALGIANLCYIIKSGDRSTGREEFLHRENGFLPRLKKRVGKVPDSIDPGAERGWNLQRLETMPV